MNWDPWLSMAVGLFIWWATLRLCGFWEWARFASIDLDELAEAFEVMARAARNLGISLEECGRSIGKAMRQTRGGL